ncbi:MAG: 16S rRNA (guanine(966)-N(2))-methyltransferase RsmD [Bdellovibrionales bacterium]|nr:16S rRNA (guanine(966)-N(2))-methyltransferase RsmD [Bdellovibrionales bacterium]
MLKITSGVHRGRLIQSLPGTSTRPTTERLRQAWLNSLQMSLPDARVLDLFSGSGALGLEALSRGAAEVVFVEENPKAVKVILDNAKLLGLTEQVKVIARKVEQVLPLLSQEPPFDFVFMDPPYDQSYEPKLLGEWPWSELLIDGGRLCVESAHRKEGSYAAPAGLEIVRDERYGDSQLTFYRRNTA